jgi:hypothetical protein
MKVGSWMDKLTESGSKAPPPSTVASSTAARMAAEAAGRAVLAAAENAAKPGGSSSELKVTITAILVGGAVAGLDALKHVGGPLSWLAIGLSLMLPTIGYQITRAQVKSAALRAAGAALAGAAAAPPAEVSQ